MTIVTPFLARLDAVRERLARLSETETAGWTDPDETTGERWEAGQVWAHLAEFPGYWLGQIRRVLERDLPEPVPFGRVKSDAGRIESIELSRSEPVAELHQRLERAVDEVGDYLRALPDAAWTTRGTHPTLGEMDVSEIVERFIVAHLEEHAAQLEALAARPV